MDSPQRAKKAELLSQATTILGKRPQSGFDASEDENERFGAKEIDSGARRLRRRVQETGMLFPGLHDFPLLSPDGHHQPFTRFEHHQHGQQLVDESRGGRNGITGNQPQQFATRAMTRSRSQQMMLKNRPDNHWGTSPKEHQSIAGPTRTSDHKAGVYAAHTNPGYNGFALNPKASSARDYTSPSDTGELVEGPVEMVPSLRPPLRRDYTRNIVPTSGTRDLHSCKHCSRSFTRQQNLKRHMSRAHHESRVGTDVSSSSSSKKPSKKENNGGASAKDIGFQHYFALPSSRTASAPETQVNATLMSSMPPGANPNTDALHHLNHATEQQQVYQPNCMYHPPSTIPNIPYL
ncbi:hypothetical protein NW768_012053 [Fusarium equiseti]|uniref:C2H2-type domain-containing protein n=1 Tax=Fusarium equiseti TaxID=61235 RepID=A0ABQ8QVY1_FUSEQ|nr:hypothetical protein NW768_012053 [Fusarium equiseti]